MKWICLSTGSEWQYDSCERQVDDKDLDPQWESLKHICPTCGNLRILVDDSK